MFANLRDCKVNVLSYRYPEATATTLEELLAAYQGESDECLTATIGDHGTVTWNEETLYIAQEAYCDNYGTDGAVRYYAHAIDADGETYLVAWDTKQSWDDISELVALSRENEYGYDCDEDRLEELLAEYGDNADSFLEDESNACDWDNPVEVKRV